MHERPLPSGGRRALRIVAGLGYVLILRALLAAFVLDRLAPEGLRWLLEPLVSIGIISGMSWILIRTGALLTRDTLGMGLLLGMLGAWLHRLGAAIDAGWGLSEWLDLARALVEPMAAAALGILLEKRGYRRAEPSTSHS